MGPAKAKHTDSCHVYMTCSYHVEERHRTIPSHLYYITNAKNPPSTILSNQTLHTWFDTRKLQINYSMLWLLLYICLTRIIHKAKINPNHFQLQTIEHRCSIKLQCNRLQYIGIITRGATLSRESRKVKLERACRVGDLRQDVIHLISKMIKMHLPC